jgi:hypothetical protein
MVDVNLTEQQR